VTLESRLAAFDRRRNELLDELQSLDEAHLVARPVAGKWSILEIVEHVVLAERAILRGLPPPEHLVHRERTVGHAIRHSIVLFVLWSGLPVKVPSPTMLPSGGRDLAQLRRMWDENLSWLRAVVKDSDSRFLDRNVFEHPVAGPLNVRHVLRMDRLHVAGHVAQIRRLQRRLS
jgi:hypothetical protein